MKPIFYYTAAFFLTAALPAQAATYICGRAEPCSPPKSLALHAFANERHQRPSRICRRWRTHHPLVEKTIRRLRRHQIPAHPQTQRRDQHRRCRLALDAHQAAQRPEKQQSPACPAAHTRAGDRRTPPARPPARANRFCKTKSATSKPRWCASKRSSTWPKARATKPKSTASSKPCATAKPISAPSRVKWGAKANPLCARQEAV